MLNKFSAAYFIIKNKGLKIFLRQYLLKRFPWRLYFKPSYLFLRSIEIWLPLEHKHRYTLPDYLQLEPTSRCNMKCGNCTRDSLDSLGDLKMDDFLHIVKQFPFLAKVKLQGLGEPLLNDSVFEMAGYLKEKGITTYMATNATLITERIASCMIKYIDQIEVSIDSPDRSVFQEIRGRDSFDDALRGLGLLKATGRDKEVAINFVVERRNVFQLPEMVKLANRLGIDYINVVILQDWLGDNTRYTKKKQEISDRRTNIDDFNKSLKEAMKLADSLKVRCNFSLALKTRNQCFWFRRGIYVSWNGYVSPCCLRPNYAEFNFGNIFEKNIAEIWNSPAYINFRRNLRMQQAPAVCRGCDYS